MNPSKRCRAVCFLCSLCILLSLWAPAVSYEAGNLGIFGKAHFKRSFSVYTGPGEDYFRAEFVNGWASYWWDYSGVAKVWGTENGWLMIGFVVNGTRTCVGYIDASALNVADQVSGVIDQPLQWLYLPATIASGGAPITDDPEREHERFAYLTAGQRVTVLGYFGTWAYVEANVTTNMLARGFVRSTSLVYKGDTPVTPRPTAIPTPAPTRRPVTTPTPTPYIWPTWPPVTPAPTAYWPTWAPVTPVPWPTWSPVTAIPWPTWVPVTPTPTPYVWPTWRPVTAAPTPYIWPTWVPPTPIPYPTWAPVTAVPWPTWSPVTAVPTARPTAVPYTSTLLSSLTHNCPNTGEMLPAAFNPYQRSYILTVASWVSNICFTPTAYDSAAYITVNGQYVASGRTSSYITIGDTPKQVEIQVRSGGNVGTYTVFLQRRPSETETQVRVGLINSIYQSGGTYYLSADLVDLNYYGQDYSYGNRSTYQNPSTTLSRYTISPNCDFWYGSVNGAVHADDVLQFMSGYRAGWGSVMFYLYVIDDEIVAILPYEADVSASVGAPNSNATFAPTFTPGPTPTPKRTNRLSN